MRAGALRQQVMAPFLYSPILGSLLALLAAVGVWQVVSVHNLVASPGESVRELYRGFADGSLLPHLLWSVRATLQGFAFAIIIGMGLGLALGFFSSLRRVFQEMVYGFAAVPKLVLYPILLLLFKIGMNSEVAFVAVAGIFPILVNTMVGVQEVRPILIKVGKAFNIRPWQMVLKIFLPSIAPSLVAGLRLGYSLGVLHAVLAEMFVAKRGLGTRIWVAYNNLDIPAMYAIILLAFLVAAIGNILLWYLERRLRGRLALAWAVTG